MVFGLKDFILGSVCFCFICLLSCLMGQKKIVLKYIVFYVIIAAIQQLCSYLPQAIETILSVFTLFIRVMIPVVLFASTFIATTKVSELIAAMYSLKIPRSITITFAMVLRFFPTFSEEIHNIYDAMKLRGIKVSWKNVFTRPLLLLEAMAVPIVMRSASIKSKRPLRIITISLGIILAVIIIFWFFDIVLNGMIVDWFENNYMTTYEEYIPDVGKVGIIHRPNWDMLKQLLFVVVIAILFIGMLVVILVSFDLFRKGRAAGRFNQ